jgi:hypothetical protein
VQGELRTHSNFRKYKKREQVDREGNDINVLGQPKTQFNNEDFQRSGMANVGHVIGTGIFSNRMGAATFKQ